MLHTKFRENWPAGSGEEDFSRVFTVYRHGGHLGDPVVSEKSMFSFSYMKGLGSRSRNNLDLQYSFTFINSNSFFICQFYGHRLQ